MENSFADALVSRQVAERLVRPGQPGDVVIRHLFDASNPGGKEALTKELRLKQRCVALKVAFYGCNAYGGEACRPRTLPGAYEDDTAASLGELERYR